MGMRWQSDTESTAAGAMAKGASEEKTLFELL